jgi:hypothetical protein
MVSGFSVENSKIEPPLASGDYRVDLAVQHHN